jgi:phosphonatase-like hydrolase
MRAQSLPELVVFDLAGTTVYDGDAVNASFRAALAAAGIDADPARVNAVMGLPKPEAIRILVEGTPLARRVDAIHADFVTRMIEYYRTASDVREIPGASDLFRRLKAAGVKTAVNTGFNRAITDVLLDRMGWRAAGLLDASAASDEAPRGRPHPDMIRRIMAALGVTDPARVAKVGDTPADLLEGASAGCGWVIGVTEGTHSREQLLPHPHSHLIGTVNELAALFDLPESNLMP